VGDGEKLLTCLNSALKVLLGTDIFLHVPKKVKFCFPVKYVNIHIFFHLTWLSQKTVGDGEKLLTYLNSALKLLSGLDIFPRGAKNKLNFVDQCNQAACCMGPRLILEAMKQRKYSRLPEINFIFPV
jgi:hypothetical protein